MDVTAQVYEAEATGWLAGLYADIRKTFRAPIVNWIFRTTAANHPAFLRYAWGQLKPIFETRAFGSFTVAYRDAVLSDATAPTYRPGQLDVTPAEFRELRGQLATFDVVAPRLAVLFETVDRGLSGDLDPDVADDRAATAPLPDWVDRDRGLAPSMTDAQPASDDLGETLASVREFHGLGEVLPSIYRCLAQWPGYLVSTWSELRPAIEAVDPAAVHASVASFVDRLPYRPRLAPDELAAVGIDEAAIGDVQALFDGFNRGPDQTVLPAIHVHAASVGAAGRRHPV